MRRCLAPDAAVRDIPFLPAVRDIPWGSYWGRSCLTSRLRTPNAYKLSNREAEVMRLVVLGKSNQEIADELFLAVGTVKTHIHNILVKTEQQNRTTLILHFWKR